MTRFAFYGRVSTEDQQDPAASRAWQLDRSRKLIEGVGTIVEEFFDIGQSRSLPWKRRPEASRLLEAFSDPQRRFDAVVIGEPQRAFYGHQFGLTFPVFTHYGVALWVPEVGGAVDPGSEAHDLVMTLFGGMSKGERMRIKTRVKAAMAAQAATQGRYLGGRPPYGYRLVDIGPHPHPEKAALGAQLHQLASDPATGPVVQRIFASYLAGKGYFAIAEALTADGIPSPSGHDRARNSHRLGAAWSKSAVRAILTNPRYTGYQVWGKQRRDEVLLDVDDVAAGHETVMRWNEEREWTWSIEPVHEPLVSRSTSRPSRRSFAPTLAVAVHVPAGLRNARTRCEADSRAGSADASCRATRLAVTTTTAAATQASTHDPSSSTIRSTCTYARTTSCPRSTSGSATSSPPNAWRRHWTSCSTPIVDTESTQLRARLEHELRQCDQRVAKYRALLDDGVDSTLVAGWIKEVTATRQMTERRLTELVGREPHGGDRP